MSYFLGKDGWLCILFMLLIIILRKILIQLIVTCFGIIKINVRNAERMNTRLVNKTRDVALSRFTA